MSEPLLNATNLRKEFATREGGSHVVLDGINVSLHEDEVVALLGRSGSGKSTLLRCLIGLSRPTSGDVSYRGQPVTGLIPDAAMVFQTFALFPWLTVQQNVELALEGKGLTREERTKRALAMLDVIGLDGFESAFPKELSGGMRQRVGFARALAASPQVLFMDEPFSALDVLTSENLRGELLDLWLERRIPTRCILIVTHNIEEAIEMADRVLVLGTNPGRIRAEVSVTLRRPRDRDDPAFRELVDRVYEIMTTPQEQSTTTPAPDPVWRRLPLAPINRLKGLLDRVAEGPDHGHDDLPVLAEEMRLDVDDLFPLTDALEILGFAKVSDGDITLTPAGQAFAEADILRQKEIFAEHLLEHVPLIARIRKVLDTRPDGRAPRERFLHELEDTLTGPDADETLEVATDWGRYAELFEFDANSGVFTLDPGPTTPKP